MDIIVPIIIQNIELFVFNIILPTKVITKSAMAPVIIATAQALLIVALLIIYTTIMVMADAITANIIALLLLIILIMAFMLADPTVPSDELVITVELLLITSII